MTKTRSNWIVVFATLLPWTTGTSLADEPSAAMQDPSRLLVVDCLLPGQIRKLGGRMTYLSPPRPVRETASKCAIRGGEYVAYDRANYETALRFWLPLANEGDAAAQSYVGEIYEKGLGTNPDYVEAASWYKKAADQGYQRAQLNLAYLYEQGLGVKSDSLKALNLYRQAGGINDDDLTYESEVTAVEAESQRVIDALTTQLEQQNKEAESLQSRLALTQQRLTQRRQDLQSAQNDVDRLQQRFAGIQSGADNAQRRAELDRLEAELGARETTLARRAVEVADLEAAGAAQRAQLAAEFKKASVGYAELKLRVSAGDTQADAMRTQLQETELKLGETEGRVVALMATLATERAQLAEHQAQILKGNALSEQQKQEFSKSNDAIAGQQAVITTLQEEQRSLLSELTRLREQERHRAAEDETGVKELVSTRAQLASMQQKLLETEQRVGDLTDQLAMERQRIVLERQQLKQRQNESASSSSREIERLQQELESRESRLADRETLIVTLREESRFYLDELARLRDRGAEAPVAMRSIGPDKSQSAIAASRRVVRDLQLGDFYALIIGNNDYRNMPSLETAVNDARAVSALLKDRYGFQTQVLLNADRAEILLALNEYREVLGDKDSLLVYYAGHGELDRRNRRGYWLPVNAARDNTTEWISDQMVTDQISLMSARHVLVVADSCYSGSMTRNSGLRLVARSGEKAALKRLKKLARLPSRTVLTSGGEKPVIDGGGGTHSVFAQQFLKILRSNKNVLEGSALYSVLFDDVKEAALRFNVDQSPQYSMLSDAGHLNGEFLFVPLAI